MLFPGNLCKNITAVVARRVCCHNLNRAISKHQPDPENDLQPSCHDEASGFKWPPPLGLRRSYLVPDLVWRRHRCRWRWASPPPPPREARCWLFPCCWLTCCASSCPWRWVWRLAAAGLLHWAAEHWAQLEASAFRKSYLEQKRRKNWETYRLFFSKINASSLSFLLRKTRQHQYLTMDCHITVVHREISNFTTNSGF